MRKGLFVLMALVLILGVMPVAGVSAEEPYSITLLGGPLDNPYWIALKDGAESMGAKLGVKVTTLGPSQEGGGVEQAAQMEDRIAAGDDAILIAARSGEGLVAATELANKAGIPVIAVDTAPTGGELVSYIRTDNVAGGMLGGEWLAQQMGGKGTVLLLEGIPGVPASDERRDGAQAALAKYPDITVITLPAGFETAKGQSVTEDTLTAHPDLAGIFASNDMMAIGAYAAVADRDVEDQVAIVGYDAIPAALEMIQDGRLGATVAQFPSKMGDLGVRFAVRVLQGKEVPKDVDSGTLLVTADNVLEFALMSEPVKAEKEYSVALLGGPLDNPYWIALKDGAESMGAKLGVKVTTLGPSQEGGGVEQAAQMEDRIAAGDDAILIAARSGEGLVAATELANKAGIPVIAVDTAPTGGELVSYIRTDNVAGGMLGGEWLAQQMGGKGTVLLLEGIPGVPASDERRDGAQAALAKYPDITVITLPAGFETAKGQSVTEDTLTAHPDLAGIFASNDMMAIGAYAAVADRDVEDQVAIVGYDAIPAALEMIQDGRLGATVAQFPGKMGAIGLEYAVRTLQGEAVPAIVDSGTMLVTADNVDLFADGVYGQ